MKSCIFVVEIAHSWRKLLCDENMEYTVDLMNINYEHVFAQPVFQVANMAPQIFEGFYKTINPRFAINLSDMQPLLPGNSMGNIGVKITLFNGNGVLEVTATQFSARFLNIRSKPNIETDIEIVKDCIALSEDALAKLFPENIYSNISIKILSWLKCKDGAQAAYDLLRKHAKLELTHNLDATDIESAPRAILKNRNEGWGAVSSLERSGDEQFHLFFLLDIRYSEGSKYNNLSACAEHVQTVYLGLLAQFGLEPAQEAGK